MGRSIPCGHTGRFVQQCTSRHVPDRAVLDPFADQPELLAGVALVAHLGLHLVLAGGLGQHAGLPHGARQRLLNVDVLAPLHGGHRNHGVQVVRRGDDHRVDVLLLVEHLAEIRPLLRVGILLEDGGRVLGVHVAQGHDVLARALGDVVLPHAADADAGDVQLLARGRVARAAQDVPGHNRECRHGRRRADELAAATGPNRSISSAGFVMIYLPL